VVVDYVMHKCYQNYQLKKFIEIDHEMINAIPSNFFFTSI